MAKSLHGQRHPLAVLDAQDAILNPSGDRGSFDQALTRAGLAPLRADRIDVLQMNLGKLCNQTCKHCHVDAGPDRTEVMTRDTIDACLREIDRAAIPCADLTGGAPEMNPHFRWLVEQLSDRGVKVMDRCNLTILTVGGFRDLPAFFARHGVQVVASLPYFLAKNTDAQRGHGVFGASIKAIRELNALGYGQEGSGLELDLVYNPVGAFLAPNQASFEPEYRRELADRYGLSFNKLFVITNMPINRFLEFLVRSGQYEAYMNRLIASFNPSAALGVMCRSMVSVGWDGKLYDCDFNQMLGMPVVAGHAASIHDTDLRDFRERPIATGSHCFGCTVGSGSSCGGATVPRS